MYRGISVLLRVVTRLPLAKLRAGAVRAHRGADTELGVARLPIFGWSRRDGAWRRDTGALTHDAERSPAQAWPRAPTCSLRRATERPSRRRSPVCMRSAPGRARARQRRGRASARPRWCALLRARAPAARPASPVCEPLLTPRPLGPFLDLAASSAASSPSSSAPRASPRALVDALSPSSRRPADRAGVRGPALGRRGHARRAALPGAAARGGPGAGPRRPTATTSSAARIRCASSSASWRGAARDAGCAWPPLSPAAVATLAGRTASTPSSPVPADRRQPVLRHRGPGRRAAALPDTRARRGARAGRPAAAAARGAARGGRGRAAAGRAVAARGDRAGDARPPRRVPGLGDASGRAGRWPSATRSPGRRSRSRCSPHRGLACTGARSPRSRAAGARRPGPAGAPRRGRRRRRRPCCAYAPAAAERAAAARRPPRGRRAVRARPPVRGDLPRPERAGCSSGALRVLPDRRPRRGHRGDRGRARVPPGHGGPRGRGPRPRSLAARRWCAGDTAGAETAVAEAVAILERLEPGPELARAYAAASSVAMNSERAEAAFDWGERALALIHEERDRETLVYQLNNRGTMALLLGRSSGLADIERSIVLAEEAGLEDHVGRGIHLGWVGSRCRDRGSSRGSTRASSTAPRTVSSSGGSTCWPIGPGPSSTAVTGRPRPTRRRSSWASRTRRRSSGSSR